MHVNDVFLFFKNYFWHQHIKTIQNIQIILNFNKKKLNFLEKQTQPRSQTRSKKWFWPVPEILVFSSSFHKSTTWLVGNNQPIPRPKSVDISLTYQAELGNLVMVSSHATRSNDSSWFVFVLFSLFKLTCF